MSIRTTALQAAIRGGAASLLSAAALAVCGKLEGNRAAGPINGPSQWLWGRRAAHARRASARHTLIGYAIHHLASTGWALLFERWRKRRGEPTGRVRVRLAVLIAAVLHAACQPHAEWNLQPLAYGNTGESDGTRRENDRGGSPRPYGLQPMDAV